MSVLLLAFALAAPAADVPAALAEARALVDAGRPKDALGRLFALDAADPRVGHLLGVAHYHADDYAQAVAALAPLAGAFAAGSPEAREVVQVLGLSLYLAGRVPEAIPHLEKTREWAEGNLELAQVLGMAYIQARQPARAREALARTFGVPADSAAAHLLAAQMMIRVERDEMADEELKLAIAKDPRLPHARYLRAQTALFRGRVDEAATLLREELDVHPANAMALYLLGDAYTRQGKTDAAIAALQRSLWINPFYSGPYILLGKAYMEKKQPATAEGMLRRAIEHDPNNRTAHYLLGQLLQQAGRAEEARRELEIAERLQAAGRR
jgi:tetratricopeptide (TPR) repeat protein